MGSEIGLLFDLDGTLWDSSETCSRAWNACLSERGTDRRISANDLRRCMGKTLHEFAVAIFPNLAASDGEALVRDCFRYEVEFLEREGAALYDGVAAGLKRLNETYPIFVVSNCDTDYLASFLDRSGVGPWIAGALCHGDTGLSKAHNLLAMRQRHALSSAVYVGDTRSDELAAAEARMAFVFAEYGFGEVSKASLRIRRFPELVDRFLPTPPATVVQALRDLGPLTAGRVSTAPTPGDFICRARVLVAGSVHSAELRVSLPDVANLGFETPMAVSRGQPLRLMWGGESTTVVHTATVEKLAEDRRRVVARFAEPVPNRERSGATSTHAASDTILRGCVAMYRGEEVARRHIVAESASGIYVRDQSGREYIDCGSGTFDQALGYNHPAIREAMHEQIDRLPYLSSALVSPEPFELARQLVEISPSNLTRVHLRDVSGSTAMEGAIKIAQATTGRRDVISLFMSHHGQTALATEVSGNAFRKELYPARSPGFLHVPPAYCYRCFYDQTHPTCDLMCVSRIRQFIEYASSGSVAAMVVEPILGNGGNIAPPRGYFRKLRALCDEYGIVLIFDEVQSGMGRTGYMFAAQYYDVFPDMMVLGKGLGGPVPRAAILMEERFDAVPRSQHAFTGSGSLVSTATALATICQLRAPGFLEHVRAVGAHLGERLQKLAEKFPRIGDVRGYALMWGLEFVAQDGSPDADLANRIIARGLDHGLILRGSRYGRGSVVKVRPPLVITRDEIDKLVDALDDTLEAEFGVRA
ncbi:MAG: aminotransferase class III-fold pyridoxal phosphate-dependent enzyme [Pseudomonadota bacterium]|nr:aminotransferase class III-fold pyridoxal phosphate-dependent enzyme [Pseudomonadota bacterium]